MAAPIVLLRGAATARAVTVPSPPPSDQERGGRRWWPWLAGAPALMLVGLVVLVLVLLAGTSTRRCGPGGLSGAFTGPGSLGGVAGTGLTRAQVRAVRAGSPHAGPALTEGAYVSTAYGPPSSTARRRTRRPRWSPAGSTSSLR